MTSWQPFATAPALRPRPGFDWLLVNWGGPPAPRDASRGGPKGEPRTDRCSYCGDLFPARDEGEFVPLVLFRPDGWCAEFCDHCQAAWWGVETFPEPAHEC